MAFQNARYTDARYSTFGNAGRDLIYNVTQVNSSFTAIDQTLKRLEPARMDAATRLECLEGTRTDLLQFITYWAYLSPTQRVLWLHGLAGSGKSTLATTVANFFREQGRLGAFLFFDRDVEERCKPSNVIRTLAYRLAFFDARIGTAVAAVIETTPDIAESPLRFQFMKLLVEPLSTLPTTEAPIIVILDALDECGSAEDRRSLLALLAAESIHLPPFIHMLITSRAEFDIRLAFESQPHVLVQELELTSDDNIKDILSFIRRQMAEVRSKCTALPLALDWPGDAAIYALREHAAGLFVWASTACRFIDGHDPCRNLEIILRGDVNIKAESALSNLYRTALESAGMWDDVAFCADFCAIMGTILVAKNPLSDTAIDTLLSLKRPSRHTISRLGCVLSWSDTEPIRMLHPSFADFLSDHLQSGSRSWYINTCLHNRHFAIQCLNYLCTALKKNMCNLKLSVAPVSEILPEATSYACVSWVAHITDIREGAESIADVLEQFLFRHLLHWPEAMSILKKSRTTIVSVHCLLDWLRLHLPNRTKLHDLVKDASRFVQTFASCIEEHPLLIYLSALPFTPIHTLLYKTFADDDVPRITGGYNKSWPPLIQMFSAHEMPVVSIAFAPDGTQIISGYLDSKIRVWDASSGAQILAPLTGHKNSITSVAISPDGRWIVSGSGDRTIRLWDTSSGEEVLPPMRGHTDVVNSVAFSPNGTRIASGSSDRTVRVWDVTSGCRVLSPLRGHTGEVSSVTFSPDGSWIISGSSDKTIRVWDSIRGTEISKPFQGHSGSIWWMAVSPDAKWIASCSGGGKIRLWDAKAGVKSRLCLRAQDADRFKYVTFFPDSKRVASISHRNRIHVWDVVSGAQLSTSAVHKQMTCMALSPCGERLAIGYEDATIGLWNVMSDEEHVPPPRMLEDVVVTLALSPNGDQIASTSKQDHSISIWDSYFGRKVVALLQGHKNVIVSIGYSPNGTVIASGSADNTIRVWDTTSGRETLVPLRGHEDCVNCVAFSPDGNHIASGSDDLTVCLWDSKCGVTMFAPFRGHEKSIESVKFSPDGTRLLSACWGGIIRAWDIASGTATLQLAMGQHEFSYFRSVGFSSDGRYIKAAYYTNGFPDEPSGIRIWDSSGARVVKSRNYLHDACTLNDPLIITPDAWIVQVATRTVVGKLPSMVSVWRYAASNASITFTTDDRRSTMFTMHFPPTVLTSPGTWDPTVYQIEDQGRDI